MKRSSTEIDDILSSLDGISRADARPFMYTRVMARIREENTFLARAVGFFARPVIAFACLSAVVVANVYTVFTSDYEHQDTVPSVASANLTSDVLQNDNYILAVSDVNQYVNQ
ncbi:MAG TPA: hypothetical protein PKE30_17225 [Niabella sp.]|nr:hypothetical protein [Niabella sp.]